MDEDVRQRLTLLETRLHQLGMDLQESLGNVDRSPAATCIQVGVAVEHMLRQLWKKLGLTGSPEDRRFEDLLRLTTKKMDDEGDPMPRDIVTAIREIQLRRNDAAHYWGIVKRSAATNSLGNLADVTHWYFARFLTSRDPIAEDSKGPLTTLPHDPESSTLQVPSAMASNPTDHEERIAEPARDSIVETRPAVQKTAPSHDWRVSPRAVRRPLVVIGIIAGLLVTELNHGEPFDPPDRPGAKKEIAGVPRGTPPIGQQTQPSVAPNAPAPSNGPSAPPIVGDPIPPVEGRPTLTQGQTEKAPQTASLKTQNQGHSTEDRRGLGPVEIDSSKSREEGLGQVKEEVDATKPPIREALEKPNSKSPAIDQISGVLDAEKKKHEQQTAIPATLPPIPPEVEAKLVTARKAVAEAVFAAQDAGLVETSIDPPPILDILITGRATDLRTLKDTTAKRPYGVSPEVFGAWFCGYGKLAGIDFAEDVRIMNPSAGLKQYYDQRAAILRRHIAGVRAGKSSIELQSTDIPRKVESKLEIARRAVAEAIVAAQDAGLVETSIDPPPILDILITGRATDLRTFKNTAQKPYAISPEVWAAWFTGYGKLEGINYADDVRIINPSAGLKQWYDLRARILEQYRDEFRKRK